MSIIEGYGWAINRSKLERAIEEVKGKGKLTEEAVKEVYVRLLGAVREEEVEVVEDPLEVLTLKQLKSLAEERGIEFEGLKKAELIEALKQPLEE